MLVLKWLNNSVQSLKKGRLAGFFLLLTLCGCQPDWAAKSDAELFVAATTEPGAALELGQRRASEQQWPAALKWQQQALQLGQSSALAPLLQLMEHQHGYYAAAEYLSDWMQSARQQPDIALTSHYGLWQGGSPVSGWQAPHCALTLQPVVQNQQAEQHWQYLLTNWQQDNAMNTLAVCFAPAVRVSSLQLRCSMDSKTRVQCDYQHLADLVNTAAITQLLVIGGEGGASYNNGILQLAQTSAYSVFRHEFAHVLGFIDEYRLPVSTARQVCLRPDIPNLLTDLSLLTAHQQRFSHQVQAEQLIKVETCAEAGRQAYALADWSLMRYHEAELSPLYLQLMQHQLSSAKELMPVQYLYAYKARMAGDMVSWALFMRQAAALGYPDAIRLLEEAVRPTDRPAPG